MQILKKILQKFFKILNYINDLNLQEEQVLLANMPKWYGPYQYSFFGRALRFLALLTLASAWYVNVFILSLNKYLHIDMKVLVDFFNSQNVVITHACCILLATIFIVLHCAMHVIIRIIFFKKICKNSPWTITKCITVGIRACVYISAGIGGIVGIPGLDYVFERTGSVAPFRWMYAERHAKIFGYNNVSCGISEGELTPDNGPISHMVRQGQIKTWEVEAQLNAQYLEMKEKNLLPIRETAQDYFNKKNSERK